MADMAIFQVQGPDSVMQSGASPGSSVGDTNDWILFLWFILIVFCPWFRSASPEKILIKMRAKTPGNGIAGRRGEF